MNSARSIRSIVIALLGMITIVVALMLVPRVDARTSKVIDGSKVDSATYASRYPWLVSVQYVGALDEGASLPKATDAHICGGSLIEPDLVITAAHCVIYWNDVDKPEWYRIISGRRDLRSSGGNISEVEAIYPHPQYNATLRGENDVALIKLAEPVAGITPIDLVGSADGALWGNGAGLAADPTDGPFIVGWGARTSFGPYPISLPSVPFDGSVPIHSDAACADGGAGAGVGWGRLFVAESMLCAGELNSAPIGAVSNGTSPCNGDSGGPLIVSDGLGGFKLAGIVSFGLGGCMSRESTAVFTRVDGIRDWVDDTHVEPVRSPDWGIDANTGSFTGLPTVRGGAVVGKTVTCGRGGVWTGDDVQYTYAWYRSSTSQDASVLEEFYEELFTRSRAKRKDGMTKGLSVEEVLALAGLDIIEGQTGQQLALQAADEGYSVGCVVTGTNDGWSVSVVGASSDVVKLGRNGSATRARLEVNSATCDADQCTVTVSVGGPKRKSVIRIGGFSVGTSASTLPASFENESRYTWSWTFPRAASQHAAHLWGIDDLGRRTKPVTVSFEMP